MIWGFGHWLTHSLTNGQTMLVVKSLSQLKKILDICFWSSSIESFPVPLEHMPSDIASLEESYAALGDSSGMACSVQLDKCQMEQ